MRNKYIFDAFVIVTVVILFFVGVRYIFQQERELKAKDSIIAEKNAIITYRQNKEGKLIADKLAAESTLKAFKEGYPQLVDQLQKDFDIKIKNLRAYIKAEFEARGSGNSTVTNNNYYTDSTGKKVPYWKVNVFDGYLDLEAKVFDSLNAPYTYAYRDTIQFAMHTKKKWFLGNEKLYGSGLLSNKNAKITNSTNVLINDYRDKRFYLGAGVSYDINGRLVPSVHVGYALFKF